MGNMIREIKPNSRQQECIDTINGKIMVLAGPGTGKTFTIIQRIKNMISQNILPEKILCLTFSETAAREMKERLVKEIGICASAVNVFTYHAFCNDIIKEFHQRFELADEVELIDETRNIAFIKSSIDEFNPVFYRTKFGGSDYYISEINRRISAIKKARITKKEYFDAIEANPEWQQKLNNMIIEKEEKDKLGKTTKTLTSNIETQANKIGKAKELWSIYELYDKKMFENNLIDFNDMINFVIEGFNNDEEFKKQVAKRYSHILVDEYQDTSYSQNEIVFGLIDGSEEKNVFVVGDDDQIIYGFQGANMTNLETFLNRYPDTKVITLNENNRSTQTILDFSHKLIEQDNTRLEVNQDFSKFNISKVLTAKNEKIIAKETPIRLFAFDELLQEQNEIVEDIKTLINSDKCPVNDDNEKKLSSIALLFRKHDEIKPYTQLFKAYDIPFQIQQGKSIFDIQASTFAYFYLKALQNHELYSDKLFSLMRFEPLAIDIEDYNSLIIQNKLNHKDFITNMEGSRDGYWKNKEKITKFLDTYNNLKSYASCETLKNTIIKMLNETGILEYYANNPVNKLENLLALQKLVNEADNLEKQGNGVYLDEYISYLDNAFANNISICIEDPIERNAVQLMTYHASKGREFEYVYLPNLIQKQWENSRGGNSSSLPTDEIPDEDESKLQKRAEELKLLFVGVTRAKYGLTLSYSKESNSLTNYVASIVSDVVEQKEFSIDEEKLTALIAKTITEEKTDYDKQFSDSIKAIVNNYKFSPSSLDCYLTCHRQFLYSNILGIDVKEVVSNIPNYGTAFHNTLEEIVKIAKEENSYPSLESAIEIFKKNMKKQRYTTLLQRTEFENRGIAKLTAYYPHFVQTPPENIVDIELKFDNIEIADIPVKGKIDRVERNNDGTYSLYDYKTGSAKRKTQIQDGREYEKYLNQLRFYKTAFELQNENAKVSQVGLIFVEEPQGNFYTNLTDEDNKIIEEKLTQANEQLQSLNFDKDATQKACENCSYRQICRVNNI